jgi:hypothetical protein
MLEIKKNYFFTVQRVVNSTVVAATRQNRKLYFIYLRECTLSGNRNRAVPLGQQPVKAYGEGVQMGLTLLLDAQIDDYALTSSFFQGFKVFVTHVFLKTLHIRLSLYSHLNQVPILINNSTLLFFF